MAIGFYAESKHSSKVVGGSTAVGREAKAYGNDSVALGSKSSVAEVAERGIAIGRESSVSSSKALAIGSNATVTENANGAIALGNSSNVSVAGGIALGENSKVVATENNYGYNFKTKAAYEAADAPVYAKETTGALSVGSADDGVYRRITNVAAGYDDVDAVNLGQLKDALDSLDTKISTRTFSKEEVDATYARKVDVSSELNNLRNDSNAGIANAAALSALHMQPTNDGEKFQIMAGVGMHSNKRSLALGAGYQMSPTSTVTLGVAAGADSTFTGNIGFSWKVGKGTVATPASANEITTLKNKVAELEKAMQEQAKREAKLQQLLAQVLAKK